MEMRPAVNGMPPPDLLVTLIRAGRWKHPGHASLREVIPFLVDPVDFLTSLEAMSRDSSGKVADDAKLAVVFHEVRGRHAAERVELPWRDVDRSFFVAVNRFAGDDAGIALDFRTSANHRRVIANDWASGRACVWREVAPRFSQFAEALGLGAQTGDPGAGEATVQD
jgi:hypothetical protein